MQEVKDEQVVEYLSDDDQLAPEPEAEPEVEPIEQVQQTKRRQVCCSQHSVVNLSRVQQAEMERFRRFAVAQREDLHVPSTGDSLHVP